MAQKTASPMGIAAYFKKQVRLGERAKTIRRELDNAPKNIK